LSTGERARRGQEIASGVKIQKWRKVQVTSSVKPVSERKAKTFKKLEIGSLLKETKLWRKRFLSDLEFDRTSFRSLLGKDQLGVQSQA